MPANSYSKLAGTIMAAYADHVKPLPNRKAPFGAVIAAIKRNANILLERPVDAKLEPRKNPDHAKAVDQAAELIAAAVKLYGSRDWNRKRRAFKRLELLVAPPEMDNGLIVEVLERRREAAASAGVPPHVHRLRAIATNIASSTLTVDLLGFVSEGRPPDRYAHSERAYAGHVAAALARADKLEATGGPPYHQFESDLAIVGESLNGSKPLDFTPRCQALRIAAIVGLFAHGWKPRPLPADAKPLGPQSLSKDTREKLAAIGRGDADA